MFNFSFLVKLALMHMILVSVPLMPKVGLFMLCGIEGGYVILTLYQYIKSRHLKSFLLLIPKLAQSLFLLVIEGYILKSFWDLEEPKLAIPVANQQILIKMILIASFAEYGFLLINIFYIVQMLCLEWKKKKKDPDYKKKI